LYSILSLLRPPNIPFILLEMSNISKIHAEEHANELGKEEDALIVLTEEKSNSGSTEKKSRIN
jgi:hypothetical protein